MTSEEMTEKVRQLEAEKAIKDILDKLDAILVEIMEINDTLREGGKDGKERS
jgi:hypothetical protein